MNQTRKLGKQWRLMQLNIEGISGAKCDVLARLLDEQEVDVLVVQETHIISPEDLAKRGKIYGYSVVAAENSAVHGVATFVKNNLLNDLHVFRSM